MRAMDIVKTLQGLGLTQQKAKMALKIFIEKIREGLKKDGKLTISGFGSFRTRKSRKRRGRNPRTQESIEIPPRTYIKFRPSRKIEAQPGVRP